MRFLLVFFVLCLASGAAAQERPALDFAADNLDGETVYLKDLLSHGPVYLDFWALWCVPCKSELRALQTIYEKYRDSGLTVVAIDIDNMKSSSKVKAYVRSQNYTMPVLLDPNSQIFEKMNGGEIPYSVLIDADGRTVKVRTGYLPGDEKEIEADIIDLLKAVKHE